MAFLGKVTVLNTVSTLNRATEDLPSESVLLVDYLDVPPCNPDLLLSTTAKYKLIALETHIQRLVLSVLLHIY
jgi:hypothetical protein